MSGDAGGIIIGLIAAPALLAGAAAVGVAYGAIKVGQFLVEAALSHAKKKKAEKVLAVGKCSADLDAMYAQMQKIVQAQADSFSAISLETEKKLQAAAKVQQKQLEAPTDLAAVNSQIQKGHEAIAAAMQEHKAKVQKEVIAQGQQKLQEAAKALEESHSALAKAVAWQKQDAASQAAQKSAAYALLRDAEASLGVMKKLVATYGDAALQEQYATMQEAYTKADENYKAGMYEAVFSSCRSLVRQIAMAVAAQQMAQMELDTYSAQVQAQMAGLLTEMESRRYFTYVEETTKNDYEEDLDDFCQGQYAKMQELLEKKFRQLQQAKTLYEVQKLETELESKLQPQAVQIMQVAHQVMLGYHEKMKVMQVIIKFMRSQGYKVDWATPVGEDLSQKTVVNFTSGHGSSISVTLDNNAETGDIARIAMELLTFYEGGSEATEKEKQDLRDKLNKALQEAGIQGAIGCQGSVGQSSSHGELSTEENVANQPARPVVKPVEE